MVPFLFNIVGWRISIDVSSWAGGNLGEDLFRADYLRWAGEGNCSWDA